MPGSSERRLKVPCCRVGLACVLAFSIPPDAKAQESVASTPEVFRRYAGGAAKLEVVEVGAAGRAEVGSGFYVTADGHVMTNYHVVAKLVHDPERYRIDLVESTGERRSVTIIGVDVVHDLAVVRTEHRPERHFDLRPVSVARGERLYALGNPADLGLSIVEGTYNGLLEHTLYDRIHFTGSLNPGMSGGPAITERGEVVGVNVSTAGNQLSFLVPAARARALLNSVLAPEYVPPPDFLPVVGAQIREYQNQYLGSLFVDSVQTIVIEGYRLPTKPADFFNCWGDVVSSEEDSYEMRVHSCSTDDYIFISRDHSAGIFEFGHQVLSSRELNTFQFFSLYSDEFQTADRYLHGREYDVTGFRCSGENIRHEALKFRAVYCVRRYKKYEGLYDVIFKLAALGRGHSGLISSLTMSGVSFENAMRISRDYMESITWEP
ncbi:MAG: serine protease [Gemmatimonadales bacterium]|jgi:S1-C subfamily serine protease